MKDILNYVVCSGCLLVAVALVLSDSLWSLVGFAWCVVLYASGLRFPAFWRRFWRSNIRILRYFDCL